MSIPAKRNHPGSKEPCVPQLVGAQAAATPGALAVESATARLTYGQLNARANQLARYLKFLRVGPEVPVGLYLGRGADFITAALAIFKAGGAYVPLEPAYPPDRIAFMLHDSKAAVLITEPRLAARLPSSVNGVPAVHTADPNIDYCSTHELPCDAKPEDLAYIIYTSGSTGQPKGVEITHGNLLNFVRWHRRAFDVVPADRTSHIAGLSFDAAVWELWPYLSYGASVHAADENTRQAPELLRDWFVEQRITIGFVSTGLAEQMLFLPWPAETSLRMLLTGADTLHRYPPSTLPFKLVNCYGPTETTIAVTSGLVAACEKPDRPPPIGKPIDNTQIYILDEHLREVPTGLPGEIHIAGASVARGYLNRPQLTSEKFIDNPLGGSRLYKSGDLGCYLPDGQIEFLGRIDYQVKIRGYRVEPDEISNALNADPTIAASVVVAREDTPGEKRLVAYIVPNPEAAPSHDELRKFLRRSLPEYMAPSTFVSLDSLPLSANGKIDRRALPAPNPMNTLRDSGFTPPRTLVEERIAAVLAELLGAPRVSVEDNFFFLGGHSILGAQLIDRVNEMFGVEFGLRSLFENPTLGEMSAEIERLILEKLTFMDEGSCQVKGAGVK